VSEPEPPSDPADVPTVDMDAADGTPGGAEPIPGRLGEVRDGVVYAEIVSVDPSRRVLARSVAGGSDLARVFGGICTAVGFLGLITCAALLVLRARAPAVTPPS